MQGGAAALRTVVLVAHIYSGPLAASLAATPPRASASPSVWPYLGVLSWALSLVLWGALLMESGWSSGGGEGW